MCVCVCVCVFVEIAPKMADGASHWQWKKTDCTVIVATNRLSIDDTGVYKVAVAYVLLKNVPDSFKWIM